MNKELSQSKTQVINSVVNGSPTQTVEWLKFFPVGSEIIFDNPQLSQMVIAGGVWTSGALLAPYAYEVARKDGNVIDVDRYPLFVSSSGLLIGGIRKDFPEHHSSGLQPYYLSGSLVNNLKVWAFKPS